ncbi:MAG: methyltransferase domain-containing protein [Kofleriaceae bacterium]
MPARERRPLRVALDAVLFRRPFTGRSAQRYLAARAAFGDFDERLLDALAERLRGSDRLLEVGAGPAAFAAAAQRRLPALEVLALEPSPELARAAAARGGAIAVVRGVAEELPLARASVAVAVCLSSIRHVADRDRALRELRRVVRPGGLVLIAELDPRAPAERIRNHARRLPGPWLRAAFGPLIVRTAPPREAIVEAARRAGFTQVAARADPLQPLYVLELE